MMSTTVTFGESLGPLFHTVTTYWIGVSPAMGLRPPAVMAFKTEMSDVSWTVCVVAEALLLSGSGSGIAELFTKKLLVKVPVALDSSVPSMLKVSVDPAVRLTETPAMLPVPDAVPHVELGGLPVQLQDVAATSGGWNV